MESSTAALLSDIRAKNRVFRKACAQVVLLNLRIEDAKTHYLRARATGNLAFRYSYRMKLTSLEGVRDALYDFAVVKCEEIEALQARLHEVTGAVFYIVADEDSSDEDWSVAIAHCHHFPNPVFELMFDIAACLDFSHVDIHADIILVL